MLGVVGDARRIAVAPDRVDLVDVLQGPVAQHMAGRAREGKIKQNELEGATFQVTSLGMFGVTEFGAQGRDGRMEVVYAVVRRRDLPRGRGRRRPARCGR